MEPDSQTLDAHNAGANEAPLARRPARIAAVVGWSGRSGDTELVSFWIGHHDPPVAALFDPADFRGSCHEQLGHFGALVLVGASGADVEMNPILDDLVLRNPQEQDPWTDAVGVDDRTDRSWLWNRDVAGAQVILPRQVARRGWFFDVSEGDRPEHAHTSRVVTIDRDLEWRRHTAYGTAMPIGSLHEIVVDCSNPEALARFWQALIGGDVEVESGDWVVLDGDDDGFYIGFQRVREPKSGKNRIHLDVEVDDLAVAVDEAEQLGARKLGAATEDDDGGLIQVMADPGGNEFCLILP